MPENGSHRRELLPARARQTECHRDRGSRHGSFDPARRTKMIDILRPIHAAQHKAIPADLAADDLATGAYLNGSIRLPNP
jgi:hypothetical protein